MACTYTCYYYDDRVNTVIVVANNVIVFIPKRNIIHKLGNNLLQEYVFCVLNEMTA